MSNIVEVGLKLDKSIDYYIEILNRASAVNVFNCKTHDIYWTNKKLDGLTENEMKKSCLRYRICQGTGGTEFSRKKKWKSKFQNIDIFSEILNIDEYLTYECESDNQEEILNKINNFEKQLLTKGFYRVFDTYKQDYQYRIDDMKSLIQLQQIDNIGLLLYYDNPDYYELSLIEQRERLIDELNLYGFNFSYNDLDLDKLRSLYYKEEKYSVNQNG